MVTNKNIEQIKTDVCVIGSGPGGYIAAIRAAQLGHQVVLIEREELGGVCLNKGCIPTKALLTSASKAQQLSQLSQYGIELPPGEIKLNFSVAVKRSKQVAQRLSKGVGFLMKKHKIQVISGTAKFSGPKTLVVTAEQQALINIEARFFIIATGAKYRTFPGLEHNGKRILGAWEAVRLEEQPKRVAIVGAGAIGVEFAYFWKSFGVDVTIIEMKPHLLPLEDEDSSIEVEKAFLKLGIHQKLDVSKVSAQDKGSHAIVEWSDKEGQKQQLQVDVVLVAVGMKGAVDNLGLEAAGVQLKGDFIAVNQFYQTSNPHCYAIGDVAGPPLLAHAASHEAVLAVEHLSQKKVHPIDPLNIPGCTYCKPEVASVGLTEQACREQGLKYRVGKIPMMANGKALASGEKDGHIKVLLGEHGELLGAHIVGDHATELIHEYVLMRSMEGIDEDILHAVHPHPTLGEFLGEAVLLAQGRSLNF